MSDTNELRAVKLRPDLDPGFWPSYAEPTAVARAIQMPLHPTERWINGVLNAHIKRSPSRALSTSDARSPSVEEGNTHG